MRAGSHRQRAGDGDTFEGQQRARAEIRLGLGKHINGLMKGTWDVSDNSRGQARSMEAEVDLPQIWGKTL